MLIIEAIGGLIWAVIAGVLLVIFVPMLFASLRSKADSIQFMETDGKPTNRATRVANWVQITLMVVMFGWVGWLSANALIRVFH